MAKKRFRIKDAQGNVVPYDVAAEDVTLSDGRSVETGKAALLAQAGFLAPSHFPKLMLYNVTPFTSEPDYSAIPVGSVYLDECQDAPYKRLYYKKTDEGNTSAIDLGAPQDGVVYCHQSTGKLYRWVPTSYGRDGSFQQVGGSGVNPDDEMSDSSTNAVQNRIIKAYIDSKMTSVVVNEIENLSGAVGISNSGGTTYIMFGNSSSIETTVAPSISHSTPNSNGTTVTITNNDDDTNAVIYYTTDGSTPTTESNVYSAPFTINSAVTVKAIAYADGKMPSAVTSHTIEGSSQPTLSISNTSTRSTITATGASASSLVYIRIDEGTWVSGLGTASITIQKTAAAQSVTVYAYATETGKLPSAQASQTYNISAVVYTTLEGTCQNAAPFNVTIGSTQYPVTPTGDSAPYSWSVELENVTSLQCGDGSVNNIFGNNSDTNILSITAIPSSVTEIGIRAFANMSALQSFTTGGCAAVIKSRAFMNDNAVTDLTITDACDIDSGADNVFTGCPPIRLYLGAGITKIPDNAFKGNTNLRTLEIKSKAIGTRSFQTCKNITSLTLHEGVEVIGDYAFTMVTGGTYMSGLELVIPSSCKEIKQDAFEYCKNFASVEIKRYDASDNDYPITKLSLNAGTTSTGELGLSKTAAFPIYVPDAALSTYQADQYWSVYSTRVKSINNKPS